MKSPHYLRRRSLGAVLFFALVGCSSIGLASAGKKGLLGQLGDMMSDGKAKGSSDEQHFDIDAATGTVQDSNKASTCDGQLASALVKANDLQAAAETARDEAHARHNSAIETIGGLEKDLAGTKANLAREADAHGQLKGKMTESLDAEKKRSLEELQAQKDQAQKDFEALRDEKDGLIASLKAESAGALESTKELASKEFQDLKTSKDEIIASLEAKLKMSSEELEATMRMELEKAKKDKESELTRIAADRDSAVASLTEKMEQAAADAAEVLQNTRDEATKQIAALEADRDAKLATLTQTMERAAREAADLLRTTKDEAKAFLMRQVGALKEQAEQARISYDERLAEQNQKIKNLQEYTEKMMEKKATVERSLNEANSENTHWRDLHAKRSYCNVTHVASDAFDLAMVVVAESRNFAGVASQIASDQISDGLKYSNEFVTEKFDKHWPTIQPHYEEHISKNYQTLLEPHLKKHVFPKLREGSDWVYGEGIPLAVEAMDKGKDAFHSNVTPVVQRHHKTVVNMYADYCQSSLREFTKASQEIDILKDYPPPAFVLDSWKTSCKQPRESLNALAHGTLALFVLVFHRSILGFAWYIVFSALMLVVRFSLLRFFLPSSTTSVKSGKSPPPSPTPLTASTDSLAKTDAEKKANLY